MSDYAFLRDYADGLSLDSLPSDSAPQSSGSKKPRSGSGKKPWYTKFPPLERVLAMRVQFFDNGPNPGRGHAQHTLKFRVYLDDGKPLNQRDPHWHRIVQLIEPKKVVSWAEKEHSAGKLTEENFSRYKEVADTLKAAMENDPGIVWAKMGHIGSPPGTHYFHNQFVACWCQTSGEMSAMLYLEADHLGIEPFYANKRSKRQGAPKTHALYDPYGKIAPKEADDEL